MPATHKDILEQIRDHIKTFLDDEAGDLSFKGLIPPISGRDDFKNFPNNFFPFVAVAPVAIDYEFNGIRSRSPVLTFQVLYGSRNPTNDPDTQMADMLDVTDRLQKMINYEIDNSKFGLGDQAEVIEMGNLGFLPSFHSNVDGNKKSYGVAIFNIVALLSEI